MSELYRVMPGGRASAMQDLRITTLDGSVHKVTSKEPRPSGDWMIFDDDKSEVLRLPAKSIKSIARADQGEPEGPATGPVFNMS